MTPMQQKSVASACIVWRKEQGRYREGSALDRGQRGGMETVHEEQKQTSIPDTAFQNFFFFLFRLPDPTHYVGRTTLTCRGHFAYFFVGTHGV